jgi:hypothetical protein
MVALRAFAVKKLIPCSVPLAPLPATKSSLPWKPASAVFPCKSIAAPKELSKVSSSPFLII